MHATREIRLWRGQEEVPVVPHQSPSEDAPTETRGDAIQEAHPVGTVLVVANDILTFPAAGRDMIDAALEFESKRSSHILQHYRH